MEENAARKSARILGISRVGSLRCTVQVTASMVLIWAWAAQSVLASVQTPLKSVRPVRPVLWLDNVQCGFDVRTDEGLSNLVRMTGLWIELAEAQRARLKADRRQMARTTPLHDMPHEQLKKYFTDPPDYITPKDCRGLKEMKRWATEALARPAGVERDPCLNHLFDLAAAVNNNHRSVAPEKIGLSEVPMLLQQYVHNPVGQGKRPAADIPPSAAKDLSRVDPSGSSYWQPVRAIGAQDLYVGYGRSALPDLTNRVWTYHRPKTGGGISPGFQAKDGKTRIKVKFHEVTSEPFTARIFSALGYHVDPVDYVPGLKVRYDRRLLRELHLRRDAPIPVYLFGIALFKFHYQPRFDPFQFINEAVLKDGSRVAGAELKRRIYRNPDAEHPEDDPANFRAEVEQQIEYLITCPASVQIRDDQLKSIGPWDFQGLRNEDLRELRGAGLLAAWLNWCDAQFPNTRVRLIKGKRRREYQNYFCDLGGGMGKGTGFFFRRYESPNDLDWTFTRPAELQDNGKIIIPFHLVGYKPVVENAAFKQMTLDDARWMGRKIGQLTDEQILQALVAAGFDSAQARIYLEKLISRRDRMIVDLGLAREIGLLRPDGPPTNCSYDPRKDGPVRVHTRSGQTVQAQEADWIVVHGRVIRNPAVEAVSAPSTPMHKPQILSQRNR